MPIPKPKAAEGENEYVSRCMSEIGGEYDDQSQAVAICYATYRQGNMSKLKGQDKINAMLNFNSDFRGIKLADDGLEGACWDGYVAIGMKELDGRMVPNCVPESENMQEAGKEIGVLGYKTKNFKLCPGATSLFEHLLTMNIDEDTAGMIRSAAQVADNVFGIEKLVMETKSVTADQLNEAILLVEDFKDIMEEIDEEVGMKHDTTFMDNHIEVIKSFM